jgi:hypothetical protein
VGKTQSNSGCPLYTNCNCISKAAICQQSLSLPPSQPLLQKVEFELSYLCLALEKVSHDVPTVNVYKGEVRVALDTLDGQLIKL